MGIIKEQLKRMGYNAKERAYVYGGTIIGAVAPIIGAKYLFPVRMGNEIDEVLSWVGAVALNMSSMFWKPHMPIPFYTALVGSMAGGIVAENSSRKRFRKEKGLENLTEEPSE